MYQLQNCVSAIAVTFELVLDFLVTISQEDDNYMRILDRQRGALTLQGRQGTTIVFSNSRLIICASDLIDVMD